MLLRPESLLGHHSKAVQCLSSNSPFSCLLPQWLWFYVTSFSSLKRLALSPFASLFFSVHSILRKQLDKCSQNQKANQMETGPSKTQSRLYSHAIWGASQCRQNIQGSGTEAQSSMVRGIGHCLSTSPGAVINTLPKAFEGERG